ncbi:tyrosinase central domain protein [Penicillium manginii]|uniref:tyrosinase central domain protein n=1 Tax=Penicillium manginii TaxID=203109 RepID=UPI002548CA21|nr:tyrosinase central domain protein [Penicillium manginii]KAJ5751219.1 tyrosinase central domain protein [Penicillium manginii]
MPRRASRGSLSGNERREYIDAVLCMQATPSVLSSEQYPGVRHRMDDFTVVHISFAPHIHSNGALLAWHREFLWLWEQALRRECGYPGYLPYWDWSLYANLTESPLFDSSPTSLSGDGDQDEDGCVTTGPLANMKVHFSQKNGPNLKLPPNIFDYTPHCLSRYMNSSATAGFANAAVIRRVLASPDIITFQERIDISADPTVRARGYGPHAAGHEAMMGTMRDFFSSPPGSSFHATPRDG